MLFHVSDKGTRSSGMKLRKSRKKAGIQKALVTITEEQAEVRGGLPSTSRNPRLDVFLTD